jgi:hypothetical protein
MAIKLFNLLLLLALASLQVTRGAITKCEKSATTTSGSKAVNEKKVCSGDLIFEESFDGVLDLDIWQHDSTLAGDTVRRALDSPVYCRNTNICGNFLSLFSLRLTSSNGTRTIARTRSSRMEI